MHTKVNCMHYMHRVASHYATLHYVALQYITLHHTTSHHTTSKQITSHYIKCIHRIHTSVYKLHACITHNHTLHTCTALLGIPWHVTTCDYITSHYTALHCAHRIALHHIISKHATRYHTASHHITLHTLHYMPAYIHACTHALHTLETLHT